MNTQRVQRIQQQLQQAFAPHHLAVTDDSHQHRGHPGARDGRGHFSVHIVSAAFIGMATLARHRAIYAALGEMMTTDIHALAINAHTPEEAAVTSAS